MWDRAILKKNARIALSGGKYWMAYAVCLICALVTGIFNIADTFQYNAFDFSSLNNIFEYARRTQNLSFFKLVILILLVLPLSVGAARYFVENRFGRTDFSNLFSGFSRNYGSIVGGMFTTYGLVFLWFLLFVIPGIIKGLEYSMVPFILSDNPGMSGTRPREISSQMTHGEKGSIFVLYLSFIGWFILVSCAVSVFTWLLWPISGLVAVASSSLVIAYLNATFAELYIFMRDRAIKMGVAAPEEFNLTV